MVNLVDPAAIAFADASFVNIQTKTAMRDTNGNIIYDCLEPHIFKFGDMWYAYGFNVRTPEIATTCYSSSDLKHWTLRSTILWNETWASGNIKIWYVIYNSKNKEYVGFGEKYGQKVLVYTSPAPEGPFTYRNSMTPVHGYPGDMLIYPDADGRAYLIYNGYKGSIPKRHAYVYQLTDDY